MTIFFNSGGSRVKTLKFCPACLFMDVADKVVFWASVVVSNRNSANRHRQAWKSINCT